MLQHSAVDSGVSDVATENVSKRDRPVLISQQCRDISYNLACVAQDLGALIPDRNPDSRALQASEYIAKAVGDRIPQVRNIFAQTDEDDGHSPRKSISFQGKQLRTKRSSTLNKQGKQPVVLRDPVIMTEIKIDNAPSKRMHKAATARTVALEDEDDEQQDGVENDQALNELVDVSKTGLPFSSSSSDSSDDESVDSRLSSIDSDTFDAGRWRDGLMEMLGQMQGKEEWETMSTLRKGWEFKDSERAAELVHVEALADMRDEEMRNFEKVIKKMEGGLEDQQIKLLDSLNGFRRTLKATIRDIIAKRHERMKVKRKFTFSNMKKLDLKKLRQDSKTEEREIVVEPTPKINFASELLNRISEQQAGMSERVGDIHIKETAAELSTRALAILEKQLAATETALMGGEAEEVPEPPPEVKELLKSVREASLEKVREEKQEQKDIPSPQTGDRTGRQPLRDIFSVDHQADVEVEQRQLSNLEAEVQGLALKVQELENMKTSGLMPSSTAVQKVQKVSRQQALAAKRRKQGAEEAGDLVEEVLPKKAASSPKKQVTSPNKGDRKNKSRFQDADETQNSVDLLQQLPRAKKQISDLRADFAVFEESISKVEALRNMFSLEMQDRDASDQTPGSRVMNAGSSGQEQLPFTEAAGISTGLDDTKVGDPQDKAEPTNTISGTKTTGSKAQTKTNSSTEEVARRGGSSGARSQTQRRQSITKSQRTSAHSASASPPLSAISSDPQQSGANQETGKAIIDSKETQYVEMTRKWEEASAALGQILKGQIPGTIEAGKAVLDSKMSDLKKKQLLVKELQAELQMELNPNSNEASLSLHAGGHGAGVSDSVETFASFGESATGAAIPAQADPAALTLSQRRRSRELLAEQALEGADVQGSPEQIAQLLQVQGENIELQQQINQYDEIRMLIAQRQGNLSKEEKHAIKRLLFPGDGKDAMKLEVILERKKLRDLQQQVKDKRAKWASMDDAATALKSFKAGDTTSSPNVQKWTGALQKLRAASSFFSRAQNIVQRSDSISEPQRTMSQVSDSSSRRASKFGADLIALQAAAMLARSQDQKTQEERDALEVQPVNASEQVNTPIMSFRRVSQQIGSVRRASLAGALQALKDERMQHTINEKLDDTRQKMQETKLEISTVDETKPVKATNNDTSTLSNAMRRASIRRGTAVFAGLASLSIGKDAEASNDGKPGNRQSFSQAPSQAHVRKSVTGNMASIPPKQPLGSPGPSHFFKLSGKRLSGVDELQIQTAPLEIKPNPPKKQAGRNPSKTKAVSFGEQEIHEVMVPEKTGIKQIQKQGGPTQGGQDHQLLKDESDALKAGLSEMTPGSRSSLAVAPSGSSSCSSGSGIRTL